MWRAAEGTKLENDDHWPKAQSEGSSLHCLWLLIIHFSYVIPTNNAFPIRGDMDTATFDGHDSNSFKIYMKKHIIDSQTINKFVSVCNNLYR